jgi:hypothetical protein
LDKPFLQPVHAGQPRQRATSSDNQDGLSGAGLPESNVFRNHRQILYA